MPVDFLTMSRRSVMAAMAENPRPRQLARYFYLDDADRSLVCDPTRRAQPARICLATLHGTVLGNLSVRSDGCAGRCGEDLAAQLAITDPFCLSRYRERPATHREHAGEIQRRLGYRDFSDKAENFRLHSLALYAGVAERRKADRAL